MVLKSFILFIWSLWDPFYCAFSRLRYVRQKGKDQNVFRVRVTRYKGRVVVLSDGTCIRKNDLLLKIHLHNVSLLKQMLFVKNDIKKGKHLYRLIKNSLPGLAEYLQHHPRRDEIKGIIGITTLTRGCCSLGFEMVQISNKFYKMFKWTALLPICFLSAERPINALNKKIPAYLFIPKQKLLRMYLQAPV